MCYTRVGLDRNTLSRGPPRSRGLAILDDFSLLWLLRMVTELSIARPTAGTDYETLIHQTRGCAMRPWSISMATKEGPRACLCTTKVIHPATAVRLMFSSHTCQTSLFHHRQGTQTEKHCDLLGGVSSRWPYGTSSCTNVSFGQEAARTNSQDAHWRFALRGVSQRDTEAILDGCSAYGSVSMEAHHS